MRILQYNDTYEKVGGTETYVSDLLFNLTKLGHEVFWFANGNKSARQRNHILLPASQNKLEEIRSKYFFDKKKYQHFKSKLSEFRPDVVHLHHNRYHTYELFQALSELKIPVVQTIHDYTILCPSQYYPQAYWQNAKPCDMGKCEVICSKNNCVPLSRRFFYPFLHDKKRTVIRRRIQTFIAPTQKIKSYLERADFQNVEQLPFYIDPSQWTFDVNRVEKNVLLFVGRVEINKGIYLLIDAVKEIQKRIPTIQLQIIGKGSQMEAIQQKIEAEKLFFIRLIGIVPHETIKTYFLKANICVVPTIDMEQFGLVGIEALASGTAVIGSNRGGIPEWCIPNKTGLLFEPNAPETLVQALFQMLENDKLREQLTFGGMKLVQNEYTLEQHFQKLLSIYQKAQPLK